MAMWVAVLMTLTLGAVGIPMVKLNNGVEMPVLAFAAEVGTWTNHWGWGCSIMMMIIISIIIIITIFILMIILLKHVLSINLYLTVFLHVELVTALFSLQVWEPDVCKSATSMALEAGFRFIWSSTLATWCRKSIYQGPTVTSGWNP